VRAKPTHDCHRGSEISPVANAKTKLPLRQNNNHSSKLGLAAGSGHDLAPYFEVKIFSAANMLTKATSVVHAATVRMRANQILGAVADCCITSCF
jgi:hypothetical protein